jgi:hypothetical protein
MTVVSAVIHSNTAETSRIKYNRLVAFSLSFPDLAEVVSWLLHRLCVGQRLQYSQYP